MNARQLAATFGFGQLDVPEKRESQSFCGIHRGWFRTAVRPAESDGLTLTEVPEPDAPLQAENT